VNLAALAGGSNALPELRRAHAAAVSLPADAESVRLLLRIAHLARETATRSGLELAQQSLEEAGARARAAGLKREAAEALGLEGHVAAARDQPQQARNLWLQALQAAPLDAYDLRYQWEWQLARDFEAAGDQRRALAAYRRSVGHLEKIRREIPVEYASGRSSFRETLEPLYLGLADLLLREAAKPANAGHQQQLLREARASLEQLKIDELRDYFRDACIQPLRQTIDVVDPRTAVLYPVLFPDRLELLLSAGGRIEQRTLPVRRETIELAAEILALKLRYEQPIAPEARQLYDWLIAPLAPALQQAQIETLVFVPGGALRTVPAAVLRGPQGYLVEDYAIATAPGLQLLQPEALRQGRPKTLIAGVSQPGPVIDELPDWWVSAMVQQHRRALRRGADSPKRGASVPVQGRGDENAQSASAVTRAARDEKIAALSLPGVAAEIAELSTKTAAEVLHNQDFLLNRFVGEVEQHPYRIVHIASHGLFQGPPEENFIVTYDRKLDMRRLAAALKPRELDRSPIEILVLSACQTAEGDDRTPLGLSGIALQSGARSALGSLWPVGDAATQQLMAKFYAALADGQHSKAEALRQAQQSMIHSGDQAHPSDWAAFILVGNWL
jgi:CHAT domain-containing protein